jgi:UDP-3-O-[3-hydroxymyristoyl] glucosamine N-acyltransferase
VMTDIPAGERWAGAPAKPVRVFFREVAALERLGAAERRRGAKTEATFAEESRTPPAEREAE